MSRQSLQLLDASPARNERCHHNKKSLPPGETRAAPRPSVKKIRKDKYKKKKRKEKPLSPREARDRYVR